jgi:hypothetical protein
MFLLGVAFLAAHRRWVIQWQARSSGTRNQRRHSSSLAGGRIPGWKQMDCIPTKIRPRPLCFSGFVWVRHCAECSLRSTGGVSPPSCLVVSDTGPGNWNRIERILERTGFLVVVKA